MMQVVVALLIRTSLHVVLLLCIKEALLNRSGKEMKQ